MSPLQAPTTNHLINLHPQRREDYFLSLCLCVPFDRYVCDDDDDDVGDDPIVLGKRRLGFGWEGIEDMDLLDGHIAVDSAKVVGITLACDVPKASIQTAHKLPVEDMQVVNEGRDSVGSGDVDCCKLVAKALWAGLLAGVWDHDSDSEEVEAKVLEVFEQDHEMNMAEVG